MRWKYFFQMSLNHTKNDQFSNLWWDLIAFFRSWPDFLLRRTVTLIPTVWPRPSPRELEPTVPRSSSRPRWRTWSWGKTEHGMWLPIREQSELKGSSMHAVGFEIPFLNNYWFWKENEIPVNFVKRTTNILKGQVNIYDMVSIKLTEVTKHKTPPNNRISTTSECVDQQKTKKYFSIKLENYFIFVQNDFECIFSGLRYLT